jgi:hypothetical protein
MTKKFLLRFSSVGVGSPEKVNELKVDAFFSIHNPLVGLSLAGDLFLNFILLICFPYNIIFNEIE